MKRRILGVFSAYAFLVEMRIGIFGTFFSIYVVEHMDVSYTQLGIMWTLVFGVNALSQMVWGWASDRFARRKFFLVVGELIPGIVFFFIPTISDFMTLVFVLTAIQIAWSMATPAWKALIAEHSAPKNRGELMGKITMSGGIGSIIGIYVVSDLIAGFGYAYLFYFISICMVSAAFIANFAEEPEGLQPSNEKFLSISQMKTMYDEHRSFTHYTLLTLLFSFALALIERFISLYVWEFGATIPQVGYIFIVRNASETLLMYPMGKMTDRIGRVRMLQVSLVISAAAVLLFGLSSTWWWLFPVVLVESVGWSGYVVSSFAVLSSLTPRETRGTYMGFHSMILTLSKTAPLVAGPIADRHGLKMLFFSSFGLCIFVVMFFFMWLQESRETIHQSQN